jgi:hypothetical protein
VESHTRRRLSGRLLISVLTVACVAGVAPAPVEPIKQYGAFALLGGTTAIVSEFWAERAAESTYSTLKIRQFQLDGKTPILRYDREMQKLMHLIVVRDDFATFQHLHPAFDTVTGTFAQPFVKEANHRYYVYADTTPLGIGQQVFRFTIESDGPLTNWAPSLSTSAASVVVGPYTVALGQTMLTANQAQTLNVNVSKDGQPARDLGPYLGAAAHAVFINTATLAYVHVHPMVGDAPSMAMDTSGTAGPFMQMKLPALAPAIYKLWIEFLGENDTVYTAPFTILAQ